MEFTFKEWLGLGFAVLFLLFAVVMCASKDKQQNFELRCEALCDGKDVLFCNEPKGVVVCE